jgi:hypothetical protein
MEADEGGARMQITGSNMTLGPQWAHLHPDEPVRTASADEVRPAPEAAIVATVNLLDTDHDGWLDEDDIPYDQLMRLERKAEADAEVGAIYLPAATPLAPRANAAAVEPKHRKGDGATPQIDLLA